jgi:condensin complex subunit 3
LDGILAELIIPAVKSKDPSMRERGMITLGLCCLIHRVSVFHSLCIQVAHVCHEQKMAINSFSLFLHQVEKASANLKLKALQIVFDLLTMYERDFLMTPGNEEVSVTWFSGRS